MYETSPRDADDESLSLRKSKRGKKNGIRPPSRYYGDIGVTDTLGAKSAIQAHGTRGGSSVKADDTQLAA